VGQMLRQAWGLCGKIIWINLRNERTCYLIYWTALVFNISQTVLHDVVDLN
jgi:hypothetical protein